MSDILDLFPPGAAVDEDGDLVVGGCRARRARGGVRHAGAGRRRGGAARAGARVPRASSPPAGRDSRVVFASKAFPCTAVQRVMVEEGLGLDVAGGGEIVTALEGGRRPGAASCCTATPRATTRSRWRVEHGIGAGRGRQRRRRRPARGDRAAASRTCSCASSRASRPTRTRASSPATTGSKFGLAPGRPRPG